MSLLRDHVFGERPVEFQVVSDQKKNFASAESVNYENPYVSVGLPIFSIHGNHDDPARDGGFDALAALDLLATSSLINYFGQVQKVDKIEISPLLLRKGSVQIALYGLGHIREERLNRAWQNKKLTFMRPTEDDVGEDDRSKPVKFFYILVLHQNREIGRGLKTHIHEDMIPKWFDVVVWGHEHECRVELQNSTIGTYRITQPGSSVATSLVVGEARPKNVCVLSVRAVPAATHSASDCRHQFKLKPIPLTMVRPFLIEDVVLADIEELEASGAPSAEDINKVLAAKVEEMIEIAQRQAPPARFRDQTCKLNHPEQVLIRLRVDHTGFDAVNVQRFGGQFVGKVANPSEILHFARVAKRQAATRSRSQKSKDTLEEPAEEEQMDVVRVEDLVKTLLDNGQKRLEVLDESKLNDALLDYVDKAETNAFSELVNKSLRHAQREAAKNIGADDEAYGDDTISEKPRKQNKKAGGKGYGLETQDDEEEDEEGEPPPRRVAAGVSNFKHRDDLERPRTKHDRSFPRSRKVVESNDDLPKRSSGPPRKAGERERRRVIDDDESDEPPKRKRATLKQPAAKRRAHRSEESDEEGPAPTATRRSTRDKRRVNYAPQADDEEEDVDDIIEEFDAVEDFDDEDEETPPRKKAKRARPDPRKRRAPSEENEIDLSF